MKTAHVRVLCGALLLVASAVVLIGFDARSRGEPPAMPREDDLKPKWKVGDAWTVEVTAPSVALTTRPDPDADKEQFKSKDAPEVAKKRTPPPAVTQYKFSVEASEKVGGAECFRVEVTALPDPKGKPVTKLWYDAKAMTLRQIEAQVPAGGRFATITENYSTDPNAPTPPAIGPLSALPVELPMFVGGRPGEADFSYQAAGGAAGAKRDLKDLAFAVNIKQKLEPTTPDEARSLVPKSFTRDLTAKPLVKVTLKGPERNVTQLWEAGQPWPVFTSSGATTSRLVSVTRAKP